MAKCIFPGTFDPITNGHLNVIHKITALFDVVIVAVLHNPHKTPMFSVDERVQMIQEAVANEASVQIDSFQGLLVDFAKSRGVSTVIRGLRDASDFTGEFRMAQMNRTIAPEVVTLFVPTDTHVAAISSTLVKEVARYGGDVSRLVPNSVERALSHRFP